MTTLLRKTRAAFDLARDKAARSHASPPGFLKGDDPLGRPYAAWRHLCERGSIVWGHIVQANTVLFAPGRAAAPALFVHGEGSDRDIAAPRLAGIAEDVMALKGKRPRDARLRAVAELVTDEMARPNMALPLSLTADARVRLAASVVHPEELPLPYLATTTLPLLVFEDLVAVLPVAFWEPDLKSGWLALAAVE